MEISEILDGLKTKIKESKRLTGFNSRHFAFRNWHATVMQLLRELPSSYLPRLNDFKALTFEDTRFKRGRKFLTSPDNSRYIEDLNASVDILKTIVKTDEPVEDKKSVVKSSSKTVKSPKTSAKSGGGRKPVKKTDSAKAAGGKKDRPARTGSSLTGKKKKA